MARLSIIIDDKLERRFRKSLVYSKKGDISKKIAQLIEDDLRKDKGEK